MKKPITISLFISLLLSSASVQAAGVVNMQEAAKQKAAQQQKAYHQAAAEQMVRQQQAAYQRSVQQQMAQRQQIAYKQAVTQQVVNTKKKAVYAQAAQYQKQAVTQQMAARQTASQQAAAQQIAAQQMAARQLAQRQAAQQQAYQERAAATQLAQARHSQQEFYENNYVHPAEVKDVVDINDIWQELEVSSEVWPLIIQKEAKVLTIKKYIQFYAKNGIVIRHTPEHYSDLIDGMFNESDNLLSKPFKEVLRFVAVLEYDFDNGQDRDLMARKMLGANAYKNNRKRLGLDK